MKSTVSFLLIGGHIIRQRTAGFAISNTEIWRQIAHAAFKAKRGRLWDSASRIAHQLRVCGWRLRQVSEAYRDQLWARSDGKFAAGQHFQDQFTWLVYLAIQSFLLDACILRDYIAE